MQPTPATSGNHAGVYPSDAQQAASSTSAIPAMPAMPVLRAGTPQQALLQPVRDGDTTAVRKLLANGGVNLNDVDPDTRLMPLMLASRQGHDDVALVLTKGMQGAHHQASPCRGASASPSALPRLDGNNGTCPPNSGTLPAFRAGKPGSPLAVSKWELLEARSLARLVADGKLKLGGPLSQERIDELAHMLVSPHGELTEAKLDDADVDAAIVTLLLEEMKRNETLVSLELGSNKMGDAGASSLSKALKVNSTLTTLALQSNKVGDIGAGSLSEALEVNRTLADLDLSSNKIGATGAGSLSTVLKVNSTLTKLHLRGNKISDIGASSLSTVLKVNRTLTKLDLSSNEIGDLGAGSLSTMLEVNRTLNKLDLRGNKISATGAGWLWEVLENKGMLTKLKLV